MNRNSQPRAWHFRRTLSLGLFGALAATTFTLNTARAGTVLIPGSGTAGGGAAVVVGGSGNNANAFASGIFTGFNHTNNGVASAILTGIGNFITARNSYIGCGNGHVLAGTGASTILSGIGNVVDATGDSAAVLNGTSNTVGGANSVAAGAGVNSQSNNSFTFGTNVGLDITAVGSVALGDSDPASPEGDRTTIGNINLNYGGLGSDTFTSIFHGGYLFATDNRMLLGMPGPFQGLAVQNPGGLGTPAFVGINTRLPAAELDVVGSASLSGTLNLPTTTDATTGVINQNGAPMIHSFGTENFFAGVNAGNFTMTGDLNTAVGKDTLLNNTTGDRNTAIGDSALRDNTTGGSNQAIGRNALRFNTTGGVNTAIGSNALFFNTEGIGNIAIGSAALQDNLTGNSNVAVGGGALQENTTADSNTALGRAALTRNMTGSGNTAAGSQALFNNIAGTNSAAFGKDALINATGSSNTALGNRAGEDITTGTNNIAIGRLAGENLTTGSNNIAIDNSGVAGESSTTRIGTAQTRNFTAGIRGITTDVNDAVAVVIDSNGQLGTVSSSRRYKEAIADMGDASERLRKLRPVTFQYKKAYADGGKPVQFGLIAEEVAEVFPELAVRNAEGKPETVKYHLLAPLLLNEMQKMEEEKDAEIAALEARLTKLEKLLEKAAE